MPSREPAIQAAARLMLSFAERTGLSSERPPQRYLWTEAFAVCNYLALAAATGEERYAALALRLVEQVHHVLGRHRPDDPRTGWLSGLGDRDGESHPTLGGLRIGKPLRERAAGERLDDQLEWERDGQYFHYLTKWMHALDQVARSTRQPQFNLWARELASAAHAAFVHRTPEREGLRMIWKASIDLSRPLVTAMGQHDPLDGLVTCAQLRATASLLPGAPREPNLDAALADFAELTDRGGLWSADPLGLGGLMMDAARVAQLIGRGAFADDGLLETLLVAALAGLRQYLRQGALSQRGSRRLAFRELGLAIGLHAIELMQEESRRPPCAPAGSAQLQASLRALHAQVPLASAIEAFWLEPAQRDTAAWSEHRDINEVMLATSLLPEGFLCLAAPGPRAPLSFPGLHWTEPDA